MIVNPTDEQWANATVTVITKAGDDYINKNITDHPIEEMFRVISFWDNENTIMVIPMSEVESVTFNLGVIEVVDNGETSE